MIELGQEVQDRITGFRGIATGRSEYLTGCAVVLVQPKAKADGEWVESRWLDEPRLRVVEATPVVPATAQDRGPDAPAPRR